MTVMLPPDLGQVAFVLQGSSALASIKRCRLALNPTGEREAVFGSTAV